MYTCFIQSFKILASFCKWADWFESYLFENPRRHIFAWCGSFYYHQISTLSVSLDHSCFDILRIFCRIQDSPDDSTPDCRTRVFTRFATIAMVILDLRVGLCHITLLQCAWSHAYAYGFHKVHMWEPYGSVWMGTPVCKPTVTSRDCPCRARTGFEANMANRGMSMFLQAVWARKIPYGAGRALPGP